MSSCHAIILAGGGGSRLWPLSRTLRPKQLLPLAGEQTLLQQTARRLLKHVDAKCLLTVTHQDHKFKVKGQLAEVDVQLPAAVLTEPCARNTLSASAYAVAKLYAYWITVNYREAYGILFNHESPTHSEIFVTRKITRALARIKLNLQDCLYLGNLDALGDLGHVKDYVEMQWLILLQHQAIATGVQYSVRQFVDIAARGLGIQITWQDSGVEEKGYDTQGRCIVQADARYFRPTEVETLLGDPSKAKEKLSWAPKITFHALVSEMADENFKIAEQDELVKTWLCDV